MTDTLEIFGTEYSGVTGIKATDSNNTTKTYIRPQGTKSITSNGNGIDVAEYASVDVSVSGSSPTLETITKTYTPSTSAITDTITPSIGYDGIEEVDVTVSAVPTATMKGVVNPTLSKSGSSVNSSGLVSIDALVSDTIYPIYSSGYATTGDGVLAYTSGTLTHQLTTKSSSDLTASGSTVTAPAGYYASQATKTVASGTEGTPTASKGTVTNHSVSVTPSVTNTAGYITGSTKTGTAVTVSASELVSGSETKTSNGTYDVTNLASLIVNVSGGASNLVQGNFTTGATGGTTGSFTIPYTGTGYPIALLIYVQNGIYNNGTGGNTTWYNLVQRYAVGGFVIIKGRTNTAPTYSTSGADNYGTAVAIYKSSSSSSTNQSASFNRSENSYTSSSTNATATATQVVRFKGDGKTVSYYVASTSYGLVANMTYQYIAVYSS